MAQRELSGSDPEVPKFNLAGLAPEIILCVADFLPKESVLSLGLCNKSLKELLFEKYTHFTHLEKKSVTDLRQFLGLLSRDLPDHFYCQHCFKLQNNARVVGSPFPERQVLDCLKRADTPRYSPWGVDGYQITFPHVQEIMKRHREGPAHGISLRHLSGIYVKYDVEDGKMVSFTRFRPRIFENRLFLCSQLWKQASHLDGPANLIRQFPCCAVETPDQPRRDIHGGSIDLSPFLPLADTTLCCPKCATNSNIQIKEISGRDRQRNGKVVCLTGWVCLGDGLDPRSLEWKSLLGGMNDDNFTNTGSWVRAAFEDTDGISSKGRLVGQWAECETEPKTLEDLTFDTFEVLKTEIYSGTPAYPETWRPLAGKTILRIGNYNDLTQISTIGSGEDSEAMEGRVCWQLHKTSAKWPVYSQPKNTHRLQQKWVARKSKEPKQNCKPPKPSHIRKPREVQDTIRKPSDPAGPRILPSGVRTLGVCRGLARRCVEALTGSWAFPRELE